jgi:(S)-ureidoglycine aminohydrolase
MKASTDTYGAIFEHGGNPIMEENAMLPGRGHVAVSYFLIAPENLVANALPHFVRTIARPLATPRIDGARFGQYLLEFEPSGGSLRELGAGFENFLYQLEGEVLVEERDGIHALKMGGFCFLPSGVQFSIKAPDSSRARTLWTKRRYDAVEGVPMPTTVLGHQSDVQDIVPGPPARYTYKELLPAADLSYDFAMNIVSFEPRG